MEPEMKGTRTATYLDDCAESGEDGFQVRVTADHLALERRQIGRKGRVTAGRVLQSHESAHHNTLMSTACEALNTDAAMMAPCSVKAHAERHLAPCPELEITICDLETGCSEATRGIPAGPHSREILLPAIASIPRTASGWSGGSGCSEWRGKGGRNRSTGPKAPPVVSSRHET
jgi:hypothetical protein